jgi:hypothetical protein
MQLTTYSMGRGLNDGLLIGIDYNGTAHLINQENQSLTLGTNGVGRIFIAYQGDVGLGTLQPRRRFHLHRADAGMNCSQLFTNAATGTASLDGFEVGVDNAGVAFVHNYENTGLKFATNGNTRMIIQSNGNVGVGDLDPKVRFAVDGVARVQNLGAWPTEGEGMELAYDANISRGYIQVYDREGGGWGTLSLGNGNVGIGTGAPAVQLEVKGEDPFLGLNTTVNKAGLKFQKNGTDAWEVAWNEGSGYLYFYRSGTRMVIEDATGDVGIGTATPAYKLQVGNSGDGTQARANAWNTFSSREFKTAIRALDPGEYRQVLDEVRKTEVVRYRYRDDENCTDHIGVIAEDAPADITTPDRKAVELADYSAFLLAAIKAQQEEIDALRAEITDLRSRISER